MMNVEYGVIEQLKRLITHQNHFAKVNWSAHLIPLIQSEFDRYQKHFDLTNEELYFRMVLDSPDNGLPARGKTIPDEVIGLQSVHIRFLNSKYAFPRTNQGIGLKLMTGAQLVFSQMSSGEVFVFLYPSKIEGVTFDKEHFLIYYVENPRKISARNLQVFFKLLWQAQLLTIASSKQSAKFYQKLKRIDQCVTNGDYWWIYGAKRLWDRLSPVAPLVTKLVAPYVPKING